MTEPRVAIVTPGQRRVILEFMRDGAETVELATRLGISPGTVSNHMTAAMRAAGVKGRCALALVLIRRQVVLRVESHQGEWPRDR